MVSKRRPEWQLVRERFVCGGDEVTHAALAAEFGCARETVSRCARREGWAGQRSQFRHQVVTHSREKASTLAAEHLARQLEDAGTARTLARRVLAYLAAPGRAEQIDVHQARLLLLAAARIENEALGIEAQVVLRTSANLEEMIRRLSTMLSDEDFGRVLDVLSVPGDGEPKAN